MSRQLTDRQMRLLRMTVTWSAQDPDGSPYSLFAEERATARSLIKRGLLTVYGEDDGSPPQFVLPTNAGHEQASSPKTEDRRV